MGKATYEASNNCLRDKLLFQRTRNQCFTILANVFQSTVGKIIIQIILANQRQQKDMMNIYALEKVYMLILQYFTGSWVPV